MKRAKQAQHGGYRPGSGRPPEATARRNRVMIRMADEELLALDASRGDLSRADAPSRSEAAREAMMRGLGAQETIE